MSKTVTVTCYDDSDGNLIMPIPDDVMEECGWVIGNDLVWIDNEDGSFTLKKKDE